MSNSHIVYLAIALVILFLAVNPKLIMIHSNLIPIKHSPDSALSR
jgi:hypothetical protein